MKSLGQHMLVINSQKIAIDLLDKRSLIYADRPFLPMGGELMGWHRVIGAGRYGERLKKLRQPFMRALGGRRADRVSFFHDLKLVMSD